MHELSVTCNIVDLALKTAQGRKVHRVTVEIGELAGVTADSIALWFPEVARGTPIETASLDIRAVTAFARNTLRDLKRLASELDNKRAGRDAHLRDTFALAPRTDERRCETDFARVCPTLGRSRRSDRAR